MKSTSKVDIETQGEQLLEELLDLRRAVAEVLGRDQYVYRAIDEAVECRHSTTIAEALRAIEHQSDDIRQQIEESTRQAKRSTIP